MADPNLELLLRRLVEADAARRKLTPVPYAPAPADMGPLSNETSAAFAALNPEPVPPRFIPPAAPDANFVSQYEGPAPTPPPPPSTLQRIFNAIGGFGAGVQGQGAQFLHQLQEPQREYQRQVERYQGRRDRTLELAERRAEREADRANRANEMLYDSEYKKWLLKNSDRSAEAKLRMAQAFTAQRDAAAARLETERDIERRHAAKEKQRNDIVTKLQLDNFAQPKIAQEIADSIVFGKPMSPATEKWRSVKAQKLERQLANIGGGGGGRNLVEIVDAQGNVLDSMPYSAVKFDELGDIQGYPKATIRSPRAPQPRAGEPGGPQGPYVPPEYFTQQKSQQAGPTFSKAEVRAHARKNKQSYTQVEAAIKAKGGIVR